MSKVYAGDADRTSYLLGKIRQEFPQLAFNQAELITVGWDHEVIILDSAIVFRFPDDDEYMQKLSGEIHTLKKLESIVTIAIPHYEFIAKDASFAGYRIVAGNFLNTAYVEKMNFTERQVLIRQLAQFLTELHSSIANRNDFPHLEPSYLKDDQTHIKVIAKRHLPSVLTEYEMNEVTAILSDIDALLEQRIPAVFIHGDVYSSHLLWDADSKKLGIIDFSDMCLGDPAIDFSELHEFGSAFVNEVYKAYLGPKDESFFGSGMEISKMAGSVYDD